MRLLYLLALRFLHLGLLLGAGFHPKARRWVRGRKKWREHLQEHITTGDTWVWFHAASLGEFEQGRNLIEALKSDFPHYKILLTFFSPSGYEIRKNYPLADCVAYLPMDHPRNAKDFLDIVQPGLVVFIKYELWLNYLSEIQQRGIPALLIAAAVTKESNFFHSPFAPLYREGFLSFRAIFTQNDTSAGLIEAFCNHPQVIRSADTRYDRVKANRDTFAPLPEIEAFKGRRFCLVAGSTWPEGEQMIFSAWKQLQEHHEDLVLIVAPHEIHSSRIQNWIDRFPEISLRYSQIETLNDQHRILWIDNIGMLSRLYHYADLAYVGGGFSGKLHNILEAAAFGCPVCFGPRFHRFPEAQELVAAGGAFSVKTAEQLASMLRKGKKKGEGLERLRAENRKFIDERAGATRQILTWCAQNGLVKE